MESAGDPTSDSCKPIRDLMESVDEFIPEPVRDTEKTFLDAY